MNDNEFTCPRCQIPLEQSKLEFGIFWSCKKCSGRAITVDLLRRTFTPESIYPLWLHAIRGEGHSSCHCPSCQNMMFEVSLSDDAGVRVDVCKVCHFVWFDMHEVDTLRPRPLPKREPFKLTAAELPETAWQKIASVLNAPVDPLVGFIKPHLIDEE